MDIGLARAQPFFSSFCRISKEKNKDAARKEIWININNHEANSKAKKLNALYDTVMSLLFRRKAKMRKLRPTMQIGQTTPELIFYEIFKRCI
jgi:hypothetical protein